MKLNHVFQEGKTFEEVLSMSWTMLCAERLDMCVEMGL